MNILITGAKGFVGRNLTEALKCIRDGKDRVHHIQGMDDSSDVNIYEFDVDGTEEELKEYCKNADFVYHLAGVNRPKKTEDFMEGNYGFSLKLLDTLKQAKNPCPVMLSSSIQASLKGRYADSDYGKSKLAGEELFKQYEKDTGAKVLIYRFPNLFGKWCKPNYNSVVATFCHNIANNLPIQVNDRKTMLELVYIDDLVEEMLLALSGMEHRDAQQYCYIPTVHHVSLGEIADLLMEFKKSRENLGIPDMSSGSFSKKLYATYLSYLSPDDFSYKLKMNKDQRGSFTEVIRTLERGQISVNISKPVITKGEHWHNTKNEKFIVVSGTGQIQLRKIGINPENNQPYPIVNYPVNGEELTVVDMIPGYTHNIINTSKEKDLVTLIWCNECFDATKPDTFFEKVENE